MMTNVANLAVAEVVTMSKIRFVTLTEELKRLAAEVDRLERRVASGSCGVTDHILLEATRRTHATTLQALALDGEDRSLPTMAMSIAPRRSMAPQDQAAVQFWRS
jgi:hypothetical protein